MCYFGLCTEKTASQTFSPRRTLGAVSNLLQPGLQAAVQAEPRHLCVLGVDPAVAGATGYGVVQSDGRRCRMLRFGAWRPAPNSHGLGEEHLCAIHTLISDLIQEFSPHGVAVESVFTAINVKTALRLAEVRGVVLLAAAQAGIPSFSYSPREVKATVAGYGHAGKEQVQQMVRELLHMSETPSQPTPPMRWPLRFATSRRPKPERDLQLLTFPKLREAAAERGASNLIDKQWPTFRYSAKSRSLQQSS